MRELKRVAFIGPAGVGKTHNLVAAVAEEVRAHPLAPFQSVLGLTFMHGARRRLDARLSAALGRETKVGCFTIDSFALSVVRRFRRHLGLCGTVNVDKTHDVWQHQDGAHRASFNTIRDGAVRLLELAEVRAAVVAAHPILVVDEFQDCADELLAVITKLVGFTSTFAAADEFQALATVNDPPSVTWLRKEFDVRPLTENRRTSDGALLRTAWALRGGTKDVTGIDVVICGQAQRAAYRIATLHLWKDKRTGVCWTRNGTVVLSPSTPTGSPFVREVLERLHGVVNEKYNLGRCPVRWTGSQNEQFEGLRQRLPTATIPIEQLRPVPNDPLLSEVFRQASGRYRLTGATEVSAGHLHEVAEQVLAGLHAHSGRSEDTGRRAMTIHSAKNREFENVVVLWPYQCPPHEILRRKLLYNAVTRAKRHALILVEGSESRAKKDPALSLIWENAPAAPKKARRIPAKSGRAK